MDAQFKYASVFTYNLNMYLFLQWFPSPCSNMKVYLRKYVFYRVKGGEDP